jgi:hypothetical protein
MGVKSTCTQLAAPSAATYTDDSKRPATSSCGVREPPCLRCRRPASLRRSSGSAGRRPRAPLAGAAALGSRARYSPHTVGRIHAAAGRARGERAPRSRARTRGARRPSAPPPYEQPSLRPGSRSSRRRKNAGRFSVLERWSSRARRKRSRFARAACAPSDELMYGDLERCERCYQRFSAPFGHRCPQASFAAQRGDELEEGFRSWLDTSEGRFAEFLARRQRER